VENSCGKHPKNTLGGQGSKNCCSKISSKAGTKNRSTKNTNSPYQFSTLEWLQTFFGLAMGAGGVYHLDKTINI